MYIMCVRERRRESKEKQNRKKTEKLVLHFLLCTK